MRPGVGEEGGWVQCDRVFFIRASGFVKSRVLQPDRVPAEMRWDPGFRVARARALPSGGRAGGDRGGARVGAGARRRAGGRADRGGGVHAPVPTAATATTAHAPRTASAA